MLKQKATYEAYIERDPRGNIVSEPPVEIKCRKTRKAKWQRSRSEMIEVTVTQYLVNFPLYQGDKLDGEELYAVEEIIGANGKLVGCKGFPRPPQGFTP